MSEPGPSKRQPSRSNGSRVKTITQIGQKAPVAPLAIQTVTHTSDAVAEPPASWARRRRKCDLRSTSAARAATVLTGRSARSASRSARVRAA